MATPTDAEISRVVAAYTRADEAPNYAASIVCQMQQESGDNYSMIWSTAYNGPFVPIKMEEYTDEDMEEED